MATYTLYTQSNSAHCRLPHPQGGTLATDRNDALACNDIRYSTYLFDFDCLIFYPLSIQPRHRPRCDFFVVRLGNSPSIHHIISLVILVHVTLLETYDREGCRGPTEDFVEYEIPCREKLAWGRYFGWSVYRLISIGEWYGLLTYAALTIKAGSSRATTRREMSKRICLRYGALEFIKHDYIPQHS